MAPMRRMSQGLASRGRQEAARPLPSPGRVVSQVPRPMTQHFGTVIPVIATIGTAVATFWQPAAVSYAGRRRVSGAEIGIIGLSQGRRGGCFRQTKVPNGRG